MKLFSILLLASVFSAPVASLALDIKAPPLSTDCPFSEELSKNPRYAKQISNQPVSGVNVGSLANGEPVNPTP